MPNKQKNQIVLNTSKVRLSSPLEVDSVVNGEGLRLVVWFQGCLHACQGCHNPETWAIDGGFVQLVEDLKLDIVNNNHKYINGITFSGGDPLFQMGALSQLLPFVKDLGLNVWLYSGERFEILMQDPDFKHISQFIDVLVDGRFVLSLLDLNLDYRGSSNQRLIDVQASIKQAETISYKLK
ncbi:MAG: anaerobic ribonucleoside-triphosphate reductase activating protein [Erysipelothrix sp.]|nr:anaerobic ribonucleoside-triphosphate reductase activating protein [Erysipelothrix sp.]